MRGLERAQQVVSARHPRAADLVDSVAAADLAQVLRRTRRAVSAREFLVRGLERAQQVVSDLVDSVRHPRAADSEVHSRQNH